MNAFAKLLTVQTKRVLREPAAVIFMVAFGPVFAVVMGLIFGNDARPGFGGRGYLDANLVSFTGILVAIGSFVLVPVDVVTQRESGVLRRFRATPLSPALYIAADVVVRFVISLLSIAVMLAVGILAFGAKAEGNVVFVLLGAALGVLAFLAAGYALSALLPSLGVAQAVGNILVYPLVFLSGAAVPLAVMPEGVRSIADASPVTQFVQLLQGLWAGEAWSQRSVCW